MLLGEDYQAVLPQQQERPSQPTPAEQHWLQHKVLNAGELGTGTVVPDCIIHPSGCVQWCAVAVTAVQCIHQAACRATSCAQQKSNCSQLAVSITVGKLAKLQRGNADPQALSYESAERQESVSAGSAKGTQSLYLLGPLFDVSVDSVRNRSVHFTGALATRF